MFCVDAEGLKGAKVLSVDPAAHTCLFRLHRHLDADHHNLGDDDHNLDDCGVFCNCCGN